MSTGKKTGIERLQIRLTVDEHMEDFAWLKALPEKVRAREVLAEMRMARRLRSVGLGLAALAPVDGPASSATAHPSVPEHRSPAALPRAAELSDEAADLAQSKMDVSFFAAVPPAH